jgi:hypothetical protein
MMSCGGGFYIVLLLLRCLARDSGGAVSRLFEVSRRSVVVVVVVAASFTQSKGSPHSLDRARNEHIGLAEVKPQVLHARRCLAG